MYEVCLPPEDATSEGGEEKSDGEDDGMKKRGVGAMVKVFHFIMKQSYICALIAMMVSRTATGGVTQKSQKQAYAVFVSCIWMLERQTSKITFICEFKVNHKLTAEKILYVRKVDSVIKLTK